MLEMRPGRPEEVLAQKALWKAAFGDEDRYIDWFYECCGASADVLEVVVEGRLASMLALLPQTLTLPGGASLKLLGQHLVRDHPAKPAPPKDC